MKHTVKRSTAVLAGLTWLVIAGLTLLLPQPGKAAAGGPYQVGSENRKIVDPARQREIGIKFYYPKDVNGPAAVIVISHGGAGSDRGENTLAHLGPAYAAQGFLAINLGHRASVNQQIHRRDRPSDVSFVLDALASGALALPAEFKGTADLEHVGHAGHSWGAYTAHALAGATFDQGQFRDPRIDAVVPISPQGPDQFGSYNRGPKDNSWSTVRIPAFILTGGAELNGPPNVFRMERWRAKPFERYPADGDKFLAIIPDQNHGQMGDGGSAAVKAYEAENTAAFFDVYLRGRTARVCEVGTIASVPGIALDRRLDPAGAGPRRCAP